MKSMEIASSSSTGEEDVESLDMNTDEATIDGNEYETDVTMGDSSFDSVNVSTMDEECEETVDDEEEESKSAENDKLAGKTRKRLHSSSSSRLNTESSKKQRKCRTSFSKSQLDALEKEFRRSNFISKEGLDSLLDSTGLSPIIIKVSR